VTDDDKPQWFVTRQSISEAFEVGVTLSFINASTVSFMGRAMEVTTEELPDGAILVCAPPSRFNHHGSTLGACDDCTAPIAFMPTAPTKLRRVCWRCAKRRGAFEK